LYNNYLEDMNRFQNSDATETGKLQYSFSILRRYDGRW